MAEHRAAEQAAGKAEIVVHCGVVEKPLPQLAANLPARQAIGMTNLG